MTLAKVELLICNKATLMGVPTAFALEKHETVTATTDWSDPRYTHIHSRFIIKTSELIDL